MSPRKAAFDVEPKITGREIVLIAAWALTTRVGSTEGNGGMPEMKVAANEGQVGTPTSGVMLTVGVNGIMGTKTEGGAKVRMFPKANLRRKATSKDLPKEKAREKDAATREGMPQKENVNDLHLLLVVPHHLQGPHLQATVRVATPGSLTP
jgi:hypothetical protein